MKPTVICHMMSSIDGRLIVERWTPMADSQPFDPLLDIYFATGDRLGRNAVLIGQTTVAQLPTADLGDPSVADAKSRDIHIAPSRSEKLVAILDAEGRLRYNDNHLHGDKLIAVLSEKVTDDYLDQLKEKEISYIFAGPDGRDFPNALTVLRQSFGVAVLLVEGGGITNGAFLKANLIDGFSIIIYPGIDGLSGIPSIVDYPGAEDERPAKDIVLRHIATENLDHGMVWVRYDVERAPPTSN